VFVGVTETTKKNPTAEFIQRKGRFAQFLVKLHPTRIKPDQTGSNRIKPDQTGSNRLQPVPDPQNFTSCVAEFIY